MLVYFEQHADLLAAITREKQIKKWRRAWKVAVIEQTNPGRHDPWADVLGQEAGGYTTRRLTRHSRLHGNDGGLGHCGSKYGDIPLHNL